MGIESSETYHINSNQQHLSPLERRLIPLLRLSFEGDEKSEDRSGPMSKRNSIPFVRLPSGMPGRALGVGGGMLPVRPHSEDYGVQQGYVQEKLYALS
jgi:hypothetical protein